MYANQMNFDFYSGQIACFLLILEFIVFKDEVPL